MNVTGEMLIGFGIILIGMGVYFIYHHYARLRPNEELEWVGFGESPFKKKP